jgi:hypothetical protein
LLRRHYCKVILGLIHRKGFLNKKETISKGQKNGTQRARRKHNEHNALKFNNGLCVLREKRRVLCAPN